MLLEFRSRRGWMLAMLACGAIWGGARPALAQGVCPEWSSDPAQATANIQACIDDPNFSEVCISNVGAPWVVRAIYLRNTLPNQQTKFIRFEAGVLMRSDPNWPPDPNDPDSFGKICLITAKNDPNSNSICTNIVLEGDSADPARIEMNFYADPNNPNDFHRHALLLGGARNITVQNLQFKSTCGDGIFVGSWRDPCEQITIRNCTTYECRRDGLSVTDANGLVVEDCVFKDGVAQNDSRGHGVLLEPNYPSQELSNIVIRRCKAINNDGLGFKVALCNDPNQQMEAIEVLFWDCQARGNGDKAFGVDGALDPNDTPDGVVTFSHCRAENSDGRGAYIWLPTRNSLRVVFDHCVFSNVANSAYPPNNPLVVFTSDSYQSPGSGVDFYECEVRDDQPRQFMYVETAGDSDSGIALDIWGTMTVYNQYEEAIVPPWLIPNLSVSYACPVNAEPER